MDEEARAEAWIRKKPKKIVQNQFVIQLLIIACRMLPFPLAGVLFWLFFSVSILIPITVVLWIVAAISYTVARLYVWRENRRKEYP